jgi:HAD superfamily hydrolase (TIGR01509 family)
MTKGFIFDMDGVIIDSEPIYTEIVKSILAELNVKMTDEEVYAFVGISSSQMWRTIKARYGLQYDPNWLRDKEKAMVAEHLQAAGKKLEPITGIPDLIKFLQQNNFKIGLASSSSRRNVDLILQKLQLLEDFNATVTGTEVTNGKPHPEIFLTCAAQLGVKPEHCFVLEDSPHGIAGAKSAKMKTIGFANPNSGNQDLSQADYLTAKIDGQLMDFIRSAL